MSEIKQFDINIFDRNKSICIEASAGTGKTYTVQHIVAKLLQGDNPLSLDKILIVTYTEKAAGELKDRIRKILQEEILNSKDKYLKEQLALVDNAPIYTIHSFCKQTLKEFSYEANQPDGLCLVDETEISDFIEKWIRDELSKNEEFKKYYSLSEGKNINVKAYAEAVGKYYLNSEGKEVPEIVTLDKTASEDDFRILFLLSENEIENSKKVTDTSGRFNLSYLNYIYSLGDKIINNSKLQEIDFAKNQDNKSEEDYRDKLEQMYNELLSNSQNITGKTKQGDYEKAIEKLENLKSLYDKSKVNRSFDIDSSFVDGLPVEIERFFTKKEITDDRKALFCYFKKLKNNVKAVYGLRSKIDNLKNYIFQTQIPELYKAWYKYKAENKLHSFDDMIRNVREAVWQEDSKLKKALQKKYKYAIIDEFQDTNQKQWDIFNKIFTEDSEHSICVVGDPKQSIYAFQGADVNVYTAAKNEIVEKDPENLPLNLKVNYRSTNKIINFCNTFFGDDFFSENKFDFVQSDPPDNEEKLRPDAIYEGNPIEPVWIPDPSVDEKSSSAQAITIEDEIYFAKFAVLQILKCCQKDDTNGKTRLQVYKKKCDKFELSNVTFSDFTVLCKSKPEMEPIKQAFRESGIPFNHYKEDNLFGGKECRDWIALFNAINAPDFSSDNRKILNECLYSSFFGINIDDLNDRKFDEPQNPERLKIMSWKKTALERKWALLQEQIYEDSEVEERLSRLDKLGSLSKLRQIGDYCVNYLYKNNCSLSDLTDHLLLLAKKIEDADDDGGELVEKGTDFDAVKIMTVHASKGLEFPVVIAPAGLKGKNRNKGSVYLYHDSENKMHMCSEKNTKIEKLIKTETNLEYQRLFYVAYTRASSIMILHWNSKTKFECIRDRFNNPEIKEYVKPVPFSPEDYSEENNRDIAQQILKSSSSNSKDSDADRQKQEDILSKLSSSVKEIGAYKLSYTSLSHGKKKDQIEGDDKPLEEEGRKDDDCSEFDKNSRQIECSFEKENKTEIVKNYPKGNLLGEAVHQTFEEAGFKRIGELSQDDAVKDSVLRKLIRRKFSGQGIEIDSKDSKKVLDQTCRIVWNTLNALLPEIQGNHKTGNSFSLKELNDDEHYAEVEFNMNPEIKNNSEILRDYINGFVDLLFVRKNSKGEKIYSIADWKTDSMDADDYVDENKIKENTDEEYSIQRVLYSYCLIKWLRRFCDKDEEWIFNNQFGGIYYVYVKGCRAGNGNGIYAQTWDSWKDLEAAFKNIMDKKVH